MTDTQQSAHGCSDDTPLVNQASNVTICDVEGVSSTRVPICKPLIYSYAFSEQHQNYRAAAERWTIFDRVEWISTHLHGHKLVEYTLPLDALKEFPALEQHIPFKLNQYWMGDIEIMITIVGNPFLVGQLQAGWFYAADLDAKFKRRLTCCGLSQTHHTLISANQGNEALLTIPYRSYRPLLNIRDRTNQGERLNLGKFVILVLNPLRGPTNSTPSASILVHVRFPNSKFSGLVSADLS